MDLVQGEAEGYQRNVDREKDNQSRKTRDMDRDKICSGVVQLSNRITGQLPSLLSFSRYTFDCLTSQ